MLLATHVATSKCVQSWQQISGVIRAASGEPIEGAQITVYWREHSSERQIVEYSGADGRYALRVDFDAFSGPGLLGQDRCNGKPESVEVVVRKEGFADATSLIPYSSMKPVVSMQRSKRSQVVPGKHSRVAVLAGSGSVGVVNVQHERNPRPVS